MSLRAGTTIAVSCVYHEYNPPPHPCAPPRPPPSRFPPPISPRLRHCLSLQDYSRRLQRLRSLRDIFDEYATINAEGVGKLMTCGDFLRAMVRDQRGRLRCPLSYQYGINVVVINVSWYLYHQYCCIARIRVCDRVGVPGTCCSTVLT